MHWNNGRFHESILVGEKVYMTDHKHIAIYGTKDYTQFGELNVNSYLYGNSIEVSANDNITSTSTNDTNVFAKNINITSSNDANIKSTDNNVNIVAKNYINLTSDKGITINNVGYGTTLPTSNNTEGKIFFKLIS